MRINALETVNVEAFGNVVWVRIHTDEGLVGLGETFRNPQAVISYLHETCAPCLLGKDPLQIEKLHAALMSRAVNHFNGFPTRSIEIRGNSAVDIALWDILGQALGCPLYQLLGGLTREGIRVYNTCAGYDYNAHSSTTLHPEAAIWGARVEDPDRAGPYEDLHAQYHRPEELAASLLSEGIAAMKIWPFSPFALATDGWEIAMADLRAGVEIVERIRKAVGDRMDILVELQGLWRLSSSCRIAEALKDLDIYWFEDPVVLDNFQDLAVFAGTCRTRVAASENLGTRAWYREAFRRDAVAVANFDMGWTGGLTEGRKIAALAQSFDRPVSPHDCTGPVVFTLNAHLLAAAPNALIAEIVRAFYHGFYREAVTALPELLNGVLRPTTGPGLGTALKPELMARADARIRTTNL
jgi:L-alanine-DL-glutamate epimerase-like enolase superfamily enzyme